ncbi:hypothetical protein LCGC14_1778440, partial [marine sediment metagenome]
YGVFDEKRYFSAGNKAVSFTLGDVNIGLNICEDTWVKDGPYSTLCTDHGVDVIVNLSASPFHAGKIHERAEMLSERSKSLNTAIVYVNLVGGQDELVFDGGSLIFDKNGECLAKSVSFSEQLNTIDLEFDGPVPDGNLSNWSDGVLTGLHSQSSGHTLDAYASLDTDKWWDFISGKYAAGELTEVANLGNTFSVDEDMIAIYAKADFSGENYRGNIGLRYVETEQTSSGYADGAVFKETVDYNNLLPSVNFAYDLSDDIIIRAAASQVMSRANYSDLKPGLAINANFGSATGGNPDLKPYEANQGDIAIEYYFTSASMASAGFFSKQIDNVVFSTEAVEFVDGCGASPDLYEQCRVTRPRSNGEGSVNGIELQLQHSFANGFGVVTNYTYVDSETTTPDGSKEMVPGVSENSFNASVFFENDIISTRLAYNWRSEWIGVGAAQAVKNDNYQQIDASIIWHAMENLDVSLEGVNLTNEVVQSYDTNFALTQNTIEFGSRYYLGVSYKF